MLIRLAAISQFLFFSSAYALTLDWHGYFRADYNYVNNYQMDLSRTGNYNASGLGGEAVAGQGTKSANYGTFFFKLKPTVLVNDNVIVYSEWNLGDPEFGFLGTDVPTDETDYALTRRQGALDVSIARLWLDVHTDFGTLQVGRAPMDWGLGLIFDKGDAPFDRYQSTSDTIRLLSKIGYLTFMPFVSKKSIGRSLGGNRSSTTSISANNSNVRDGSDDVSDVGFAIIFDNKDEGIEVGGIFHKRSAGKEQSAFYFPSGVSAPTVGGANQINAKLLDIYFKKTWYRLTVATEIPYYFGDIGDVNDTGKLNTLSALGFASEVSLNMDLWKHSLKFGSAPGQKSSTPKTSSGGSVQQRTNEYSAMFFNRNYNPGLIMFRYNLNGFGANDPDQYTVANSPYDASVVNAQYLSLRTGTQGEHWGWYVNFLTARALETAREGQDVYIHSKKTWVLASESQEPYMGWEFDIGGSYNWDENISFGLDFGVFFPGEFFKFNNDSGSEVKADRVFAGIISISTVF